MSGKITVEKVGNAIGLAALIGLPLLVAVIVYASRKSK
jgi:hypothetical protein